MHALHHRLVFGVLLAVPVIGTGCGQDLGWTAVHHMIERSYPNIRSLTTDSLAHLLDTTQRAPLLLDARTLDEYRMSHLKEAHRIDPDAVSFPMLADVPRDTLIVVYCSVGYRSAGVTERLQGAGFSRVYNLQGSIFQWANEGRPVYRGDERVRRVHPYDAVWGELLADSLHADISN